MRTNRLYFPSLPVRRFSGVLQSWFPAIHHKTFPGATRTGILQSAARRTAHRI
ncbi:MAG: hypothetical protein WCS85_02125 [Candidatus Peribacteraceae bacterium]